jgi:hypothetical protein
MSLYPIFSPAAGLTEYPSISSEHSRWRADQGITTATGVSQWDDISTVGDGDNNWVQGTGGSQPSYNASGSPAGDGSLTFDGSNDSMRVASGMASYGQPLHFFMVAKQISYTATDAFANAVNNSYFGIRNNGASPNVSQDATGGSYSNHVSMTLGTWFLLQAFFSGANSFMRLNDAAIEDDDDPGTGNAATQMRLAAEDDGTNTANIEIAEFVFFTAEVTSTDLTTLMAYFSDRYGLF